MNQKLIAHITPTISLFADDRQYVLVIRENKKQTIVRGYHTYFLTIGECFEEVVTHMTRKNLADGKDKTLKEMVSIIENTSKEVRTLFRAIEDPNNPQRDLESPAGSSV
ncbi:MAG: hypothetical protein Q7R73_02945 [bacterium]|nr:hypothetical protein [bacterium]